MNDSLMVIFLVAIALIGGGVLFIVAQGRRGGSSLDVERYRTSWLQIERQLNKDEPSSFQLVVLNADKLLDQAMRQKGVAGDTMGERMKRLQPSWSNANGIWNAHKLRNRIAHESEIRVSYDDTRRALAHYKQALKDVGAI